MLHFLTETTVYSVSLCLCKFLYFSIFYITLIELDQFSLLNTCCYKRNMVVLSNLMLQIQKTVNVIPRPEVAIAIAIYEH